jgi:hypothetical protein
MFSKDIISQSIIDAVSNVLQLDEKLNVKKRTTDTLAGRVKIPAAAGDNEHTAYKVELNAEELERVDEILDTSPAIKSYLDKSAVKRDALRNSIENKISHPDYDKTSNKIRKSFGGSDKAINKWNTINRTRSTSESVELEEKINLKSTSMGDVIKDFQTSDAPQFAGKSQAKRRQMAIAAKMAAEEYLDEDSDDKFASDAYSTTRGKVVKNKSGVFFATNKSGSTKSFTSEKQANRHAMKEEYLDEENAVDTVTMDIPLLIRIMEYSKEDAKSDMDLHKVAEKLVKLSASGKTLSMDCYTEIVGGIAEGKRPEDDSVPFVTNEDGLSGHVDNIKKIAKHTFKKLKAHGDVKESYDDEDPDVARADRELARMKAKPIKADRKTDPSKEMSKLSKRAPKEDDDELDKDLIHKEEFELGESVRSDRKKSTMAVLDRIYKKASENTKLEQNRKISPKLPKKELDEAKKESYQVYHPSYSSAVQHAEKHLNNQGFDIHPDDWFHHINAGPSKPAEGKTVSLHIPLHKDGVPSKKVAHIQVYNRGNDLANNHELNMYHN